MLNTTAQTFSAQLTDNCCKSQKGRGMSQLAMNELSVKLGDFLSMSRWQGSRRYDWDKQCHINWSNTLISSYLLSMWASLAAHTPPSAPSIVSVCWLQREQTLTTQKSSPNNSAKSCCQRINFLKSFFRMSDVNSFKKNLLRLEICRSNDKNNCVQNINHNHKIIYQIF